MMDIHWIGNIRCKNINWRLENKEQFLEDSLEKQRIEIWNSIKREYPETYDGNLLNLLRYDISAESMTLHMNIIKFSRILTLEKLGLHLRPFGTIGMQVIVLSPDREQILIGQRSHDSIYCPSFYGVPGGILEVRDTSGSFEQACLREFHEEVELEISEETRVIGITSEIHGTVGCVFLLLGESMVQPEVGMIVKGNEEWEGNVLRWYPRKNLDMFTHSNSLEGIVFAKGNHFVDIALRKN